MQRQVYLFCRIPKLAGFQCMRKMFEKCITSILHRRRKLVLEEAPSFFCCVSLGPAHTLFLLQLIQRQYIFPFPLSYYFFSL
jgi:hypothetical protein